MAVNSKLNITYFLGAGASANALPTVKATSTSNGLIIGLRDFAGQLKNLEYDIKFQEYVLNLIKNLTLIADKTIEFGTPDTYAKFLYLKDKKKLIELKNALSAFFLFEQFINKKFDRRTLIFLTTLLERNIFPENIKILSWNYDFQMQLAAETFSKERFVRNSNASVHTPPLINYFPTLGHSMQLNVEEISMVQLNGIAGSYYNSQFYRSFFEREEERTLDHLLDLLINPEFDKGSLLTFAWEQNIANESRNVISQLIATNTDVLIIIGYSFPFFNREVDKGIFESMKSSGRLKIIYYQDPYKSGDFLRNQFELSNDIIIRDIKESENYFLPLEL